MESCFLSDRHCVPTGFDFHLGLGSLMSHLGGRLQWTHGGRMMTHPLRVAFTFTWTSFWTHMSKPPLLAVLSQRKQPGARMKYTSTTEVCRNSSTPYSPPLAFLLLPAVLVQTHDGQRDDPPLPPPRTLSCLDMVECFPWRRKSRSCAAPRGGTHRAKRVGRRRCACWLRWRRSTGRRASGWRSSTALESGRASISDTRRKLLDSSMRYSVP